MSAAGISEALFWRLGNLGGVTWYPLRLPDGQPTKGGAAGVYQRISAVPEYVHGDYVALRMRRVQVTVYSDTYAAGLAAIRAVYADLAGTRSMWDGWSVTCLPADEAEDIDPDNRGLFRQRLDLMLNSEAP